jgi:GTPase SAR1 family protein
MPALAGSQIVLGWAVNKDLHPKYWLARAPKPGKHTLDDLIAIPSKKIAQHIVLVAQSGSGKSYFLGRLIEEILLKTQSRVLIIDPNSDFRRIAKAVHSDNWKTAGYNFSERRGFLPDETARSLFSRKWRNIPKAVLSARIDPTKHDDELRIEALQIDWTGISAEVLSGELEPILENEVRCCHDFVKTVSKLIGITKVTDTDLIEFGARLCEQTWQKTLPVMIEILKRELPFSEDRLSDAQKERADIVAAGVGALYHQAAVHRSYVSKGIEKFYFSKAKEIQDSQLVRESNTSLSTQDTPRLQVVDLPSIREFRFRPWIVSTVLSTEWDRAARNWQKATDHPTASDPRVPTFIVIDEAHNVVPSEPRDEAEKGLREQVRRIAAEGRKFGLYLILVSQRPDKLDPYVVSECENRVIMKLGSLAVLSKTIEVLGLSSVSTRTLRRCLEFDVGRALLAGPWVGKTPVFLYGAARRTEEGGKNLDAKHWARASPKRTRKTKIIPVPRP